MSQPDNELMREELAVHAGGARLSVRRLTPRSAADATATLVFLHEGLGSIGQWKLFPERLCARTGLPGVIYDRRGYGGSEPLSLPRPGTYLQTEGETVLPELLQVLAIDQPILIGHSDGGSIALHFAAAFPDVPLACVTMAAHVFVEEKSLAGIRAAQRAWQTTALRARLVRYHGEKVDAVFSAWADTWLRADFRHWSMVDRLADIVCPLLVIQGLEDEYGTPEQVETIVRGVTGPARPLLLESCGHSPHLEHFTDLLEAMIDFIAPFLPEPRGQGASRIGFPDRQD